MSDAPITHRSFISYIDRTREFYRAQGYDTPYRWAHKAAVPFAPLSKRLAESRITVITTASPFDPVDDSDSPAQGSRVSKQVWSGATHTTPDRLYTDDLAWDKETTHTDDVESFVPLGALRSLIAAGRIGSLTERFHGVPTDYSQRRTIEQDAPEIVARCREDEADIALLVPL